MTVLTFSSYPALQPSDEGISCGAYGTRTRDLLRDRQAF